MTRKSVHIFGGGTFSHVRAHLALCAPAFGTAARQLQELFGKGGRWGPGDIHMHLTRMAQADSPLLTNGDVAGRLFSVLDDLSTQVVVFNAALCDFDGEIGDVPSGKGAQRLESRAGEDSIRILPSPKVVGEIRRKRKDVFAVGFKTTSGAAPDVQYMKALRLLKQNSLNLVLANDLATRVNMVVTPEESVYGETTDRDKALATLVRMTEMRAGLTFTRSEVVAGPGLAWGGEVPDALRVAVEGMIQRGAYKPFMGKTVGHFAFKMPNGTIATSRRKSDFNRLPEEGMVLIQPQGADMVVARGGKPSVGGQSQRIIFEEHGGLDSIVHAHVPLRAGAQERIAVRDQMPYECGSHECGRNTSDGLKEVEAGIWAVHLDNHGPNVVFNSKEVSGERILNFIDRYWDVSDKTGGRILPEYAR
jgi:hypothetical protein